MATASEAKAEYIAKMGRGLGEQYFALWQELATLYSKWNEYVALFGTKESRITLLNEAAHSFFGMIQKEIWENILMHLARLTDSPASMGKKNLTIQNLPKLVSDEKLQQKLTRLVDLAIDKTAFCRDWRNRLIAHQDLDLAMDRPAQPLQTGSRKDVREALEGIVAVLNAVSEFYLDSGTAFDVGASYGGALELLRTLSDGVREQKRRDDRLAKGDWWEDDIPQDI